LLNSRLNLRYRKRATPEKGRPFCLEKLDLPNAVLGEGEQRDLTGSFNRSCKCTLVSRTGARSSTRKDLAALVYKAPKQTFIFVVHKFDFVFTKPTNLNTATSLVHASSFSVYSCLQEYICFARENKLDKMPELGKEKHGKWWPAAVFGSPGVAKNRLQRYIYANSEAVCREIEGFMNRDYNNVVSRIEQLQDRSTRIEVLGEIAGFPIYRATQSRRSDLPLIMVNAGTHGDEPASVEGALQFLEGNSNGWLDRFQFEVIPCLNPYGYVHDKRENFQGIDINWAYRNDTVPEIDILKRHLIGRRFETMLDLHEDWESPGYYLYEQVRGRHPAGPAMVQRVSSACPVNTSPVIEGEIAKNGVIFPNLEVAKRRKGTGVPIVLFEKGITDRLITTETPTGLSPGIRNQANLLAIEALLETLL
jgi:protein MpaA